MKGLFKKVALFGITVLGVLSFASCKEDKDPDPTPGPGPVTPTVELTDFQKAAKLNFAEAYKAIGSLDQFTAAVKKDVEDAYAAGVKAIEDAKTDADAYAALKTAKTNLMNSIPAANGLLSYIELSMDEKTEILGLLEAYAIRNGITGITLFENGGYVAYNERVQLGAENYISGYGFGTLAEGNLTKDLDSESKPEWKRYWHSYTSENPNDANYLDSQNQTVSSVYGYISASYFTTFMNETKDGYEYVPELATAMPTPVGDANAKTATKWRIPVRVGADLKYSTLSNMESRKVFNNREVTLADYEYTFKLLLTAKNNYFRGAEMASSSDGAIVGAQAYYNASKDGFNADAWNKVGIKFYEEGGKSWIEYEFVQAVDAFYARYFFNSSLYQPIPEDFITTIGGPENYLRFSDNGNISIVDNSLALGAYVLEKWDDDEIVYKKNPNYVYADEKYAIPGVHIDILTAQKTDQNAAFKEYLAGNLDSCSVAQDYLKEWRDNPLTKMAEGDTNFKMNLNALDQDTWNALFGPNGSARPLKENETPWNCEPALSNANFVRALNYSVNRLEFASSIGNTPGASYLSAEYLSDPVNGVVYNTTDAHKNAISYLTDDTDGYGYSLDLARTYFKLALQELVMDGKYTAGTSANPTVISLELAFPFQQYVDLLGKPLKQYFETAFNDDSVTDGGKFKLEVTYWVAGADPNEVFDLKSMIGQYDLSFGAISGNPFNPLSFMKVLSTSSDLNGNFCVNWATDTNSFDRDYIVYDGLRWTYDALWAVASVPTLVVEGKRSSFISANVAAPVMNEDGSATCTVTVATQVGTNYSTEVLDLVIFAREATGIRDEYIEESVYDDEKNFTVVESDPVVKDGVSTVTYTITVSADKVSEYIGDFGFDVYFVSTVNGVEGALDLISVFETFKR